MSLLTRFKAELSDLFEAAVVMVGAEIGDELHRKNGLKVEARDMNNEARKNKVQNITVTLDRPYKSDNPDLINMTVNIQQGPGAVPSVRKLTTLIDLSSQKSVDDGLVKAKTIFLQEMGQAQYGAIPSLDADLK